MCLASGKVDKLLTQMILRKYFTRHVKLLSFLKIITFCCYPDLLPTQMAEIQAQVRDTDTSRDGAVVRALASHQCGAGSIPGLGVICGLSLLLVLVLAPRGFSPGTPVFPSPQKPTFLNSNSIWKVSPISAVRAKYIWHLNKVHY